MQQFQPCSNTRPSTENRPTALPRAHRQVTGPHAENKDWGPGALHACREYLLKRQAQRLKGPVASEETEESREGEEAGGRGGGAPPPPLRQEFDVQALPPSVEEFFARLPEGAVVLSAGAADGVRRPEVRVSEGRPKRGSPVYVQMSAMADRARARRAAMEAIEAGATAASALAAAAAAAAAAEARGVSGRTRSGRAGAAPSTTAGGRGGRGGKGVRTG